MSQRGQHTKQGNWEGSKRGQYKRAQLKKEQKEVQESGLSHQEIGQILGITALEVQNIEKKALKKLKNPTEKNKELRRYARV